MNCVKCSAPVPAHLRSCPSCSADNGFPNVRVADADPELKGLKKRVETAYSSVKARSCATQLDDFGQAVDSSRVVISRSYSLLQDLVTSEDSNYVSFHKQVRSGARNPQENTFDKVRTQFEAALFPHYFEEISFGCLTLDGSGIPYYGDCYLVLKEAATNDRSSVFEENGYNFCIRHKLAMTDTIPSGYRASWNNRGMLAKAKLHHKIDKNTTEKDYQEILLSISDDVENTDFIEVHLYGSINCYSLEKVLAVPAKTREDRVLQKSLKNRLEKLGVAFEAI